MFRLLLSRLVIALIALSLVSCTDGDRDTNDPAVISSFSASANDILRGSEVSFIAVFSNGVATIDGIGEVSSGLPVTVTPLETTTYILRVVNGDGTEEIAELTVTVTQPPQIESFTASKLTIIEGETVNLTAVFDYGSGIINGIGQIESNTSVAVKPTKTINYLLNVTGAHGSIAQASITISVSPNPISIEIISPKANAIENS